MLLDVADPCNMLHVKNIYGSLSLAQRVAAGRITGECFQLLLY